MRCRYFLLSIVLVVSAGQLSLLAADAPAVAAKRVPNNGLQPQTAVAAKGRLHLVYFRGKPDAGDVFYVRSDDDGATFTAPLKVNTQPGAAIAMGNIRGARLALGAAGRPHVAWMGAKTTQPRLGKDGAPMLYTRLNDAGTAFEAERNVAQFAGGLDGGGTVAADGAGHVAVFWHGTGELPGEDHRRVYVALSADGGQTFAREVPAWDRATGACACCGMSALAAPGGAFLALYRSATELVNRDMFLLHAPAGKAAFAGASFDRWVVNQCVMSTNALVAAGDRVLAAWETEGQVRYGAVELTTGRVGPAISAPGLGRGRKHPALAVNARGDVLLAWTEGLGWNKGGGAAWQVFDAAGQPLGTTGRVPGVPAWSLVAATARADGSFVVWY